MRSEGNALVEAVEEVLKIGREAGVKVHISHLKTAGERNWQKADEVLRLLDDAIGSGLRVTCDRYPYTASSTDLDSILPSWAYAGGNDEELRRLMDKSEREKIEREIREQAGTSGYWEKIIVSSVGSEGNRWMEGETIAAISRGLGLDEVESIFRILIEEKLRVGAIFLSMSEENLRKFLSLPYCMIGSDSSARSFDGPTRAGKPHPRGFGTFPRLFNKYVREEGLLSIAGAIHKATLLAAETFGLKGRGLIGEGMCADVVIFNSREISDKATFEDPFQRPEGIIHVLVNGVPAVTEGALTGRFSGRVLKGGR
jgi:N-acyl-D-amino-acid deacylase